MMIITVKVEISLSLKTVKSTVDLKVTMLCIYTVHTCTRIEGKLSCNEFSIANQEHAL